MRLRTKDQIVEGQVAMGAPAPQIANGIVIVTVVAVLTKTMAEAAVVERIVESGIGAIAAAVVEIIAAVLETIL